VGDSGQVGIEGTSLTHTILGPLSRFSHVIPDVGDWPHVGSRRGGPLIHIFRRFEFAFRQPELGVPVTAIYFENPSEGEYEERAKLFVSRMIPHDVLLMAGAPLTSGEEEIGSRLGDFLARLRGSGAAFKKSYTVSSATGESFVIAILTDEDRGYPKIFEANGMK